MSQPIRGQGGHFVLSRLACKTLNVVEGIESLLPVKFRWIPFSGLRREVENVSANQRPGRPSCFSDRPEKHKIGRGCWDLASNQFRWIRFSGFRREVENVYVNQRPGRPSCFSDWPEKHKLGRGRWDLASCQVSLNSVQCFHRRSRKCLRQSEDRAAILFSLISPKNCWKKAPGRGCWDLASCQVFLILFSGFQRKSWNVSANHRPGGHFIFRSNLKNTNLVEGVEILLPIKFRRIPFSGFRGEVENVSAYQRPGWPFCFIPIGLKNINVVEGIERLLPVKFRWIPFSGLRREVENVSANQRPGRPSCFSDRPEKTQNW